MDNGLFSVLASQDSKSQKLGLFSEAGDSEGEGLFNNADGNSTSGGLFSSSKLSASPQGLFGVIFNVPIKKTDHRASFDEPKFEIEETKPCPDDLVNVALSEGRRTSHPSGFWSHLNLETRQSRLLSDLNSESTINNNTATQNLCTSFDKTPQIEPESSTTFNKRDDSGSSIFPTRFPAVNNLSVKKEPLSAAPEQKLPSPSPPYVKPSSSPSLIPNDQTSNFGRATSVKQRLVVLEAKDKAAHDRRQATSSPSLFCNGVKQVTVGNCPDMCPETERYLREFRHRVSVFECQNGNAWQMDHTRAVKDYSRSAADQAEPLPWELRPPEVLDRTTNYLLASIADRPEKDNTGNLWKPWYEFLWTRTRAIRKDITQQRLCSPSIVSIIEKITRFHIFCAARLVDQSMDAFDPRINSENLTQCLQTLKELYSDIHSSWGAASLANLCPCEPEFRAYMILMKLNECSVLDEVQKFPEVLRKSKEVQFAISVHSAVAEHNYVRFFRLIRKADCLTACLLHRYFGQVRSHALFALSAAFYGHSKHEIIFPLTKFVHQLGFESSKDAQDFCEHWGLQVCDGGVIFARSGPLREPELAWKERRAPKLVEGKREGLSLGDLFNGGPIDIVYAKPRSVHSSFDAEGNLLQEIPKSPFCSSPTKLSTPSLIDDDVISVDADDDYNYGDNGNENPEEVITTESLVQVPKRAFHRGVVFTGTPEANTSREPSPKVYTDDEKSEHQIQRTSMDDAIATAALGGISVDLIDETADEITSQAVNQEVVQCRSLISTVEEEGVENILENVVQSMLYEIIQEVIADIYALEIVDDLATEELYDLASNEMKKARAKHFNSVRLQKCVFDVWKSVCQSEHQKKLKNEHTLDKLLAVPGAPASCLWIGEPGARCPWYQSLWEDEVVGTKRPRLLSANTSRNSSRSVLQPLDPISTLQNVNIVVITSTAYDEFNSWLSVMLQNYTRLNRIPSADQLSGLESGLIIVGETVSNLHIPQLCLYPPGLIPSTENSENAIVKDIEFPALTSWWKNFLEKGLLWLAEVISARNTSEIRIKIENTPTAPLHLYMRCSTLNEIAKSHIESTFLKPLMGLINHWNEYGLTHPDPRNILAAYNKCLEALSRRTRDSLAISPLPDFIPSDFSWQLAVNNWHSFLHSPQFPEGFAESLKHSPEDYEAWRRDCSLLIPWGNLCIYLIQAKMDDTILVDGEDDNIQHCGVLVSAFENLGPQFSIAEIREQYQLRNPLAVQLGNAIQESPPEGPFNYYAQILQRLKDMNKRMSELSETARSIAK